MRDPLEVGAFMATISCWAGRMLAHRKAGANLRAMQMRADPPRNLAAHLPADFA
jgi:hypothetical protein